MRRLLANAVLLASVIALSCGGPSKKLVGGYRLEYFTEAGKFYLIADGYQQSGGGVFDGTVEEIGWDDKWIVARVKRIYRGDPDGLYALNIETHQVTGPLSESELKTNARLSKISLTPTAQAFRTKK